jgi:hypothetical protein
MAGQEGLRGGDDHHPGLLCSGTPLAFLVLRLSPRKGSPTRPENWLDKMGFAETPGRRDAPELATSGKVAEQWSGCHAMPR